MAEQGSGPIARQLIDDMLSTKKYVTALCMGTAVLARAGVLEGRRATGHASIADKVFSEHNVRFTGQPIETADHIITGRDDQVAEQFAHTVLQAVRSR
jgi:putative intracellular protease/amidase